MLLKDRVAIITGGGSGIGRGVAERFTREGAKLALFDIAQDSLNQTEATLRAEGADVLTVRADVSDSNDVARAFTETLSHFGRLDILVNNAGIGNPPKTIVEMDDKGWDRTIAVNLRSVFLCSRAAARQMIAQGDGGRIISVASQAGKTGYARLTPYCASKAGIILFTQAFAKEVASQGILVNCVCPGTIDTPLLRGGIEEATGGAIPFEEAVKMALPTIPLGRVGYPADVARLITFLASDEADYMTGQAINVSGGQEMH